MAHEFYAPYQNLPQWTDELYTDMLLTLTGIQQQHATELEARGIIEKTHRAIRGIRELQIIDAGSLALPVVYAEENRKAEGQLGAPHETSEFGIAYKLPDPAAKTDERTQHSRVYVPVGYSYHGMVMSNHQPITEFTDEDANTVYWMAKQLVDLKISGTLPYLSEDLTHIPDMSQGLSWPPK